MNFDSDIQSPISEAIDILMNYKISPHALRQTLRQIKDVDYYRKQMLVVLSERILKSKTYKEVANMLNLKQAERIRQIEARVVRILYNKMKGYN